jgi:hypothetical protein
MIERPASRNELIAQTLRTLPEVMDRQAYETLDLYARKMRLQLIHHEQFLQSQGLAEAFQLWVKMR